MTRQQASSYLGACPLVAHTETMFFGFDLTNVIEILGYPGIFAIVLAESGLFFGVSLPGGSLLFTSGLLASQGYLNIYILAVVVMSAAVLGDSIGYWFGSWVGPALFRREDSRFFKKAYLEQTKDFFDKHGSRTILLARFIPIVRTFAPILAGVAEMRYQTFFFYNLLGAILWGGGFVLAGYLLGETVPGIEENLEWFVLAIVAVTMIPFILHVRRSSKKTQLATTVPTDAKAVIFDLDDTLADSFTPPTEAMLAKVMHLARYVPVAIMSGAAQARVKDTVMDCLGPTADAKSIHVFTDSAANCFAWVGGTWSEIYTFPIAENDRARLRDVVRKVVDELDLYAGTHDTSRILERDTSVAFTALPAGATQLEKRAWDPDGSKREKLSVALRKELPEYEVRIGGKTTVDITRLGVNKAHGVEWLAKELGLKPKEMLFIGDAFYKGGNDAIVIPTGIQTIQTSGPEETSRILDDLIRAFQ